jgi:hypothetical protein
MKFDNRYDIVSGADSKGETVYVDRRIPQYSPRLRTKDGKPANLWKYLGTHETYETAAMDRGFSYDRAHTKVATPMERRAVEADGVSWKEYSAEIDGYLSRIEHEKVTNPPPKGLHVDPQSAIGHHRHKAK